MSDSGTRAGDPASGGAREPQHRVSIAPPYPGVEPQAQVVVVKSEPKPGGPPERDNESDASERDRPPESESNMVAPVQTDPPIQPGSIEGNPRVIPRSRHRISRRDISDEALKVLYRLRSSGYKSYLVGGGVRDLYLGRKPKDFDVGTDARPSRLKKIFRNCRIIGRRFRIAHIFFPNNDIIEVATFRRGEVHAVPKGDGVMLLDNQYGTPEEDARRRDLTINGLFYDIETFSIIDYVGGVDDLENRIVRTIKDPDESFQEDPVRMVRVLRHAARIDFTIEQATLQAIYRNREELCKANPSRLLEEFFKDLRAGAAVPFFRKMVETHLLDTVLPRLAGQIRDLGIDHPLFRRLEVLDRRAKLGQEYTNPVLLAVLLHTVLIPHPETWTGEAPSPPGIWPILQSGFQEVSRNLRISRRDNERVVQILLAFRKLKHFVDHGELSPTYKRKTYLAEALDFVEIDQESLGLDPGLVQSWRQTYAREIVPRPPRRRRLTRSRRAGKRGGKKNKSGERHETRRPKRRDTGKGAAESGPGSTRGRSRKRRRSRRRRKQSSRQQGDS